MLLASHAVCLADVFRQIALQLPGFAQFKTVYMISWRDRFDLEETGLATPLGQDEVASEIAPPSHQCCE
jgi:hypothetical protein